MDIENINELDRIPDEIVGKVETSVINTFASIIGEEPNYVKEENGEGPLNGIIGNVTVFNSEHTLSLMLAIPKDTALYLSEVFIGMELPFESDDMGDLIGEVSNILAGDVAANVEKVGFRGQSSLPTATRGSDLTLFMPTKPPTEKMKFSTTNMDFWLTLVLSESN
ncbi:chemotaxis protein CheX [Aliifodinibius sp. S!AR15-10]|uniref:chemotaxis protein CheX n=1 Tax=Aliifodinibius sp. S!AR15-10 TaxID=2950437 RepID=UPI0028623E2B|nr:chemotaxis protein CheX [Aliifodinibius sp. S!AR15-10]MDR8392847.1 chemotaxis protein CheX [Aliifodinibius sp. S!AR15-10]